MQFSKDTFFIALRDRLATVNPSRAIAVGENEPPTFASTSAVPPLSGTSFAGHSGETTHSRAPFAPDSFVLRWGGSRVAEPNTPRPLLSIDCTIAYCTAGADDGVGCDRGRMLAQLDAELLQMCAAQFAPKTDYTVAPPAALGTNVLWTRPQLGDVKTSGAYLQRFATVTVLFFPEVDC